MNFTPDELSDIALVLREYGISLVGRLDPETMKLRRKIWALRDRIDAHYKSQLSSAEGQ